MRPVRTRPWRALPSDKKMQWAPLTLGLCSRKPPPLQPEQVIHLPEPGQAPVHPVRHGQHSGLSGLRHRHGEWGFRPASTRLSAPPSHFPPRCPGSGLHLGHCREANWVLPLWVAQWGRTLGGISARSRLGLSLAPFPASLPCHP